MSVEIADGRRGTFRSIAEAIPNFLHREAGMADLKVANYSMTLDIWEELEKEKRENGEARAIPFVREDMAIAFRSSDPKTKIRLQNELSHEINQSLSAKFQANLALLKDLLGDQRMSEDEIAEYAVDHEYKWSVAQTKRAKFEIAKKVQSEAESLLISSFPGYLTSLENNLLDDAENEKDITTARQMIDSSKDRFSKATYKQKVEIARGVRLLSKDYIEMTFTSLIEKIRTLKASGDLSKADAKLLGDLAFRFDFAETDEQQKNIVRAIRLHLAPYETEANRRVHIDRVSNRVTQSSPIY